MHALFHQDFNPWFIVKYFYTDPTVISNGLQRGDTVLLGAAQAIGEGKQVRVSSVNDQAGKATTPTATTGSR